MLRVPVVFLLGPPGSGKTTLGAAACARLGLRFVDLPDDAPSDVEAIESAGAGVDVLTLPWRLQNDAAILRSARRLGPTVALWAHPETLHARSRQPVTFTPRLGLATHRGFGRRGTSCLEFRRLARACELTLDLDGLTEAQAVDDLADAITKLRPKEGAAAQLEARRACIEEVIRQDVGRVHDRAVTTLADAMARFLISREQAGASPRTLRAAASDLHVAAMLVFMYEPAKDERVLDRFRHGPPNLLEFERKVSDSPTLVARYERNLRMFARFLRAAATRT